MTTTRRKVINAAPLPVIGPEWQHELLPQSAQDQLKDAAAVDLPTLPGESLQRSIALNDTAKRIRLRYPNLFRPDAEPIYPRN
ncbi:hypothetical protein ABS755_07935 [Castellaniella sp. FW104-16D08]|uniref:hypothetical protein n=1 Tax=unclassified Castellaniella TaxID=2617606 RepID=UPI0033154CBE